MPVKKKSPRRVRTMSKKIIAAPENVPLVSIAPPAKIFHFEHMFAFAAAFVFIFSTLLVISNQGNAQQFQATVSANVLPLDAYSNYRLNQMNPFERWWSQQDEYHKLMYESGAILTAVMIPLGSLMYLQQRKIHSQHLALPTQPITA
ncbi:MAG: hypothetical protein Q7S47_01180 [bacterium]|nr:hypothetical protein [bacterium]